MKKNTIVTTLSSIAITLLLSAPAPSIAAEDHHHDHGSQSLELQLNNGKKWQTDAPLRQAMGDIRAMIKSNMDGIHHQQLNAADYQRITKTVQQKVDEIVNNCHLEPDADAQLHIIIARLLASVNEIEKSTDLKEKNTETINIVKTLSSYARHFDDESFSKPMH